MLSSGWGRSRLGPANLAMPSFTVNVPTITAGERLYLRVWRQSGVMGNFSICGRPINTLVQLFFKILNVFRQIFFIQE